MESKRLFGKMCFLHRQLSRENIKLYAEAGVTPVQMHTLAFLDGSSKSGRRVCQKDIEKTINLRPSSVSTLLSKLEKDGFIIRTTAEGDARTKWLELTDKGKEVCIKDKLIIDGCDRIVDTALSEEEQNEFSRLIDKIINNIRDAEIRSIQR